MARFALAVAMYTCACWAVAGDYRAGADTYRQYLKSLQAGDRLLLEPGEYRLGLPLHDMAGMPSRPIVIEAADPANPPRFVAQAGANTVSLANVRYLVLRRLELDGRNLPVDAVKAEGHSAYADFVTLEGLYIHDYAASQQNVGISTKCPAFGWTIRGNRIERVGTGIYLGDSDGSDPFVAGVIEDNRIGDTLGYNLQIKHQRSRPLHMPESGMRHDTLIRRNYFSKRASQPGPLARPNLLLGHFPPAGPGENDRYLVFNNVFFENVSEALMQGEGNLVVFGNVFVNRHGPALRIQPHNDVPKTVYLFNNTVLAAGTGISLINRTTPRWPQVVFANAIFADVPLVGGRDAGNVTDAYDQAGRYLRRPYAEPEAFDVAPRQIMRYRDIEPWPALPFGPLGVDGHALVPGEVGAVTSAAAMPSTIPGARP